MLKRLRFQLTLFYLLASMGLVALTGAGAYLLLARYLQNASDQAIQYKMALQFEQYGLPMPPELAQAEQAWLKENSHATSVPNQVFPPAAITPGVMTPFPTLTAAPTTTPSPEPSSTAPTAPEGMLPASATPVQPSPITQQRPSSVKPQTVLVSASLQKGEGGDDSSEDGGSGKTQVHNTPQVDIPSIPSATPTTVVITGAGSLSHPQHGEISDDALDARLAPIFVTPLNENGNLSSSAPSLQNPVPPPAPILYDSQAAAAAFLAGVDWRTVILSNGSRLRLLTYRTSSQSGPALLQAGRLLDDQDQLLKSFLTGILILSGFIIILLVLGSWWLSGRSLGPADRAWEQQQAFISNASHELRTPLTLLQATTEVALRRRPEPEQKEYLKNILDEIHYMSHMVDDLLLLARHDAHRLKLERQPVSLGELFVEIQRQIESLAAEQEIAILTDGSIGTVLADAARLRQVLMILLDNAIRYTPAGGTIRLESKQHNHRVKIVISDNGPGIPAEQLPHLFERFYQVHHIGINETRSNGLGLSIARTLVEAMGGEIGIDSQIGRGTQVSLELPAVS